MTDINYTPDTIYEIIVTRLRRLEQEAHEARKKLADLDYEIAELTTMAIGYSDQKDSKA